MKLLHIDSSILAENSVSRRVSAAIVAHLVEVGHGTVVTRDLGTTPIAHLMGSDLGAPSEALDEFLAAETIVIGCPMYNFAIPSQLKAWIDRICVAGKTFHYTANGPEGLAGGRRVIIAASRGGLYGPGTPYQAFEHQVTYLRAVFAFIGISDIVVIEAEGIALGPDKRDAAIAGALEAVGRLAA